MHENLAIAFLFTLIAGMSTMIGSCIAFLADNTNKKFLSFSLGFSAGIMIYVSMIEIFPEAQEILVAELGKQQGAWVTVIAFFAGMLMIALIDKLIPDEENPHELTIIDDTEHQEAKRKNLMRTGIFTALAITIHNFPEGLATFVSALREPELAIPIVFAIALHNIPEGIAVSAPIYQATGSKARAFAYSAISGLAEPAGALIGWLILLPFMNDIVYGVIFAGVAGIMVFISLDELLPASRAFGEYHLSLYGLIIGMVVMAVSLLMFI